MGETSLQKDARLLIAKGVAAPTFDMVSLDEPSQVSEATMTGVLAFGNADDPVAK